MNQIYCPLCEKPLAVTHQDRYESLDEHVSNPNGTPSLKDGYECTDENCFSRFLRVTWTEDGSEYINPPAGMGWNKAYSLLEERSKEGISTAIGSWQRSYDLMSKKKKKGTLWLKFYWFEVMIEPQYRQAFDDEPMNMAQSIGMEKKEPYRWIFTERKVTWFKREKKGNYASFAPLWQIFMWKNQDFNDLYHKALLKDSEALKKVLKIYYDTSYWSDTQKEPRFWYRIANALIRLKYRARFEILKNITT